MDSRRYQKHSKTCLPICAHHETGHRTRYYRAQTMIFITAKILVFGKIAPIDPRYFSAWLAVGFWVWVLLSSSIVEGTNVFVHSRSWILGTRMPLTVFVFQSICRLFIRTIFCFPVILILLLWFKWMPSVSWFYSLLGFCMILINAAWVQIFLGILCAKYRDFTHLVMAFVHVMFFLTPILYTPDMFAQWAHLFDYNPFTHMTVIGWGLALSALQGWGRRIPFWV